MNQTNTKHVPGFGGHSCTLFGCWSVLSIHWILLRPLVLSIREAAFREKVLESPLWWLLLLPLVVYWIVFWVATKMWDSLSVLHFHGLAIIIGSWVGIAGLIVWWIVRLF